MAQLNLLYTAPLPAGFQSGTVEVKSAAVYVDKDGHVNQPYYKYALNSDGTLTSLQGAPAPTIIGMAQGDPATASPIDVVVNITASGLPTPLRSAFRVLPVDTGDGNLDLHKPDISAPIIGPLSPTLQALTDQAQATVLQAQALTLQANAAFGEVSDAVDVAAVVLSLVPPAIAEMQAQGDGAVALASAAAGLTSVDTYADIPTANGYYRVLNGPEAGHAYQRLNGAINPRPDLEGISPFGVTKVTAPRVNIDSAAPVGDGSTNDFYAVSQAYGTAKAAKGILAATPGKSYATTQTLNIDADGTTFEGGGMYQVPTLIARGAAALLNITASDGVRRKSALKDIALVGKVQASNYVDLTLSNVMHTGGADHNLELGYGYKQLLVNYVNTGAGTGDGIHLTANPGAAFNENNNLIMIGGQLEGAGRFGLFADNTIKLTSALLVGTIVEGNWGVGGGGISVATGTGMALIGTYFEGNGDVNLRLGTSAANYSNIVGLALRNDGFGDGTKTYSGATVYTSTSVSLPGTDLLGARPGDTITAGTYSPLTVTPNGGSITTAFNDPAKTITVTGVDLSGLQPGDLFFIPNLANPDHSGSIQSVNTATGVITTFGLLIYQGGGPTSAPPSNTAVEFRRDIKATGVVSGTRAGLITVTGWTPSTPPNGSSFKHTRGRASLGFDIYGDGVFLQGLSRGFNGSAGIIRAQSRNVSTWYLYEAQGDSLSLPTTLQGRELNQPLRGLNLARNGDFALASGGVPVGWAQNQGTIGSTTLVDEDGKTQTALTFSNNLGEVAASVLYNADELLAAAKGSRMALSFNGLTANANNLRVRISVGGAGAALVFGTRHPGGNVEITQGGRFEVPADATQLRIVIEMISIPTTEVRTARITNFRLGFADSVAQLSGYPLRTAPTIRGVGAPEGVTAAPVAVGYEDVTTGALYRKTSGTGTTGWKQLAYVPGIPSSPPSPYKGTYLTRNAGLKRPGTGTTLEETFKNVGSGVISWVTLADGRVVPNVAVAANVAEGIGQAHNWVAADFAGATLTLVVGLICDQPNRARARITVGASTYYSAYHPGDGTEQLLSVSAPVPTGTTVLNQMIDIPSTANACNVKLTGWRLAVADDLAAALTAVPIEYAQLPSTSGTGTATSAGATISQANSSAATGVANYRLIITETGSGTISPVSVSAKNAGSFTVLAAANQTFEWTLIPRM